jgi:quercetin dioxygenase-like cupin family protein
MHATTLPYALAREEGQPLWFLGTLTLLKATGEQTGGAFGLIEQVLPPGFSSPWHLHHQEDEAFYVVEGEMTFLCGEARVKAGPGAFVYGPRGIPHGFRAEGTAPARLLLLCTPGGFEQFVAELSAPAAGLVLPPPAAGPPDMENLMAMAARYKIEILGPLPE